jgi:hypothetical protein
MLQVHTALQPRTPTQTRTHRVTCLETNVFRTRHWFQGIFKPTVEKNASKIVDWMSSPVSTEMYLVDSYMKWESTIWLLEKRQEGKHETGCDKQKKAAVVMSSAASYLACRTMRLILNMKQTLSRGQHHTLFLFIRVTSTVKWKVMLHNKTSNLKEGVSTSAFIM